jgi:hypothetical protein
MRLRHAPFCCFGSGCGSGSVLYTCASSEGERMCLVFGKEGKKERVRLKKVQEIFNLTIKFEEFSSLCFLRLLL